MGINSSDSFDLLEAGILTGVIRGFRKRIVIDPENLVEMCRDQALLYDDIGEVATDWKEKTRSQEKAIEFIKSDLRHKIRANPEVYGIAKITESAIESVVPLQLEYQEALEKLSKLKMISDRLYILLESAAQRKSMLREIISLYVSRYYAEPNVLGSTAREDSLQIQFELEKMKEERYGCVEEVEQID